GDFDANGRVDLAIRSYVQGGEPPTLRLLIHQADGTFQSSPAVAFPGELMATADVDGDGNLDVIGGSFAQRVGLMPGGGDGTLRPRSFATNPYPFDLEVGDLDGDGRLDLVTLDNVPPSASVLRGLGDGIFGAPTGVSISAERVDVVMADFNGDGHLDLATSSMYGWTVAVQLGSGDGSFGPPVDALLGLEPGKMVVGDVDADGHPDIVALTRAGERLNVLRGKGDGTFLPRLTFSDLFALGDIALGDFNEDGRLDVATALASMGVGIWPGHGDGNLDSPVVVASESAITLATGDLDGDGHLDLATIAEGGALVRIHRGHGDGSFAAPLTLPVTRQPSRLTM
ncbi:MAG: VCBS repeat-containing protein, partial [Myxococcales bacterium]